MAKHTFLWGCKPNISIFFSTNVQYGKIYKLFFVVLAVNKGLNRLFIAVCEAAYCKGETRDTNANIKVPPAE